MLIVWNDLNIDTDFSLFSQQIISFSDSILNLPQNLNSSGIIIALILTVHTKLSTARTFDFEFMVFQQYHSELIETVGNNYFFDFIDFV